MAKKKLAKSKDGEMALKKKVGFEFTQISEVKTTPVKNQQHSSTCWSFSTISFVETELLRKGRGEFNLSEMFIVRKTYPRKASRYVRRHGNFRFGAGGLAGDALRVIRDYGLMPEKKYDGKFAGKSGHDQEEMDAILNASLTAIVGNKKLSKAWPAAIDGILDAYLGAVPEKFTVEGEEHTPKTFAKKLGFRSEDYIEITSYNHEKFNKKMILDIPDNWSLNEYLNLKLEDFMSVIDNVLKKGYSMVWDGDITEDSFDEKKGVAILPKKEWGDRTDAEKESICEFPEPEKEIDQELRQELFDNYSSTDDHLMHIVGLYKDQQGTKFYKAKNSWGTEDGKYRGYIFLSEAYVRSKTVSVMVHQKALKPKVAKIWEKLCK